MRCYQWQPISLSEGNKLRALAIIAILAHNFLHWIADLPGENEFTFQEERWQAFLDGIWNTPQDLVRLFASYFGHYGVQIFFFLSGYGIVIKYRDQALTWWAFQKQRWRTFYPAVITSALGYLIYEGFHIGWVEVFQTQGLNLLRQMLGISNFLPENVYHPIGPWWFISVILQFYLILPLLINWLNQYGSLTCYILGATCLLSEIFFADVFIEELNVNINHTIIGHLDICLLGMWFAHRKNTNIPWYTMPVAAGLFLTSQWSETLWIFSSMLLLIFLMPAARCLCNLLEKSEVSTKILTWFGGMSMWLFLTNGYLRKPLIEVGVDSQTWWVSIITCVIFFAIVIVWSMALKFFLEIIVRKN